MVVDGQCLWLSWLSGRFLLKRSAVSIQSSAEFKLNIYCQSYSKHKNKEIRRMVVDDLNGIFCHSNGLV